MNIWRYVDKTDTCWLWTGTLNNQGYGRFGKGKLAHRQVYELLVGPVPDGLELDHLCRTPRCVKPDHLEPVTHRENILRGATMPARRAAQTHCYRGHPLDETNTYHKGNHRECRICRGDMQRQYRQTHDWRKYRQKVPS